MRSLIGAIAFLTLLPAPGKQVAPGRAAAFFPLVGAMLGAAGAGVYIAAGRVLPPAVAALLTVAFWTMISGVLHEDGLADVADAMRSGRAREKMLAILKDSRIGTYGAVAVALSVIARWQALEYSSSHPVLIVCVAAQAVPRAAMVALAWISRPVGTGLGFEFASTLTTAGALAAIAQGIAAALLGGLRAGLVMIVGAYLIVRAARWYFYRRLGGVNGDCLGAVEQLLEIFVLLLFTCRNCSW